MGLSFFYALHISSSLVIGVEPPQNSFILKDIDNLQNEVGFMSLPIEGTETDEDFLTKHESLLSKGAVESFENRNRSSRHYLLPEGIKAALLSTTPIQYKTANNAYEFIDNNIFPTKDKPN